MVSLFTQLLGVNYADSLDSQGKEYIGHAVAGAQRLETLIGGLRSYLTITSGTAEPEQADANVVVARCLENLSLLIADSGARCEVGSLPTVPMQESSGAAFSEPHCERYQIQERGGAAHPDLGGENGLQWVFSVRDNGIGIDPQYHEQILGRLWVESKVGEGSNFLFSIPAQEAAVAV